jgi:hypothetical protein
MRMTVDRFKDSEFLDVLVSDGDAEQWEEYDQILYELPNNASAIEILDAFKSAGIEKWVGFKDACDSYDMVITRRMEMRKIGIGPLLTKLVESNDAIHDRVSLYMNKLWSNNSTFFIDHDRSITALLDWSSRYGWNHRIDLIPSARHMINDTEAYWLDYGPGEEEWEDTMLCGSDVDRLMYASNNWFSILDKYIGDDIDAIPYVLIAEHKGHGSSEADIRKAIWCKHQLGSLSMTVDVFNTYSMVLSRTSEEYEDEIKEHWDLYNEHIHEMEQHVWELYADHVLSCRPSPAVLTDVTIMIIGSISHINEHNLGMNKVLRSVEYWDGLLPVATRLVNTGVPAPVVLANARLGDYLPSEYQ